jgi:tetratricopeptide (TPR) repeat protein
MNPVVVIGNLLIASLIFVPLARAQASPFDKADGAISGAVLFEADSRPAEKVKVDIKSLAREPVITALTDSTGRFQIKGLPCGTYTINVEEPGYEPSQETVQLSEPSPSMVFYLKMDSMPRQPREGLVVSLRELSIPNKARDAFEQGLERLAKRDPAGSLAHFAKAAAAFPNYYDAYYQMGVADMELGRDHEAEHALQEAIELSSGRYAGPHFALGLLFCQQEKFTEAEPVIRRGLELDGTSPVGQLFLARALFSLNRLDEAEKSAREALLWKSDLPEAHLLLVNIHIHKRDYAALLDDLDAYLKLEPRGSMSDRARKVREAVERILSKPRRPDDSPLTATRQTCCDHEPGKEKTNGQ